MGHFKEGLETFREYSAVGDVRSIGLIGAIEFVKDRKTKEPFPPQHRFSFVISRRALEHGLIVRPLGDVLYVVPALTTTLRQMDAMFSILRRSIKETMHERPAH